VLPVVKTDLAVDLTEFTQFLWGNAIPHRVVEESDGQTLFVAAHINREKVLELFNYWREGGDLAKINVQVHNPKSLSPFKISELKSLPATALLIFLSAVITLLIDFGGNADWMVRFSFADFTLSSSQIEYHTLSTMLSSGEWWRIWTPMFMHFSLLHILFNLLWVWMIGGAIERLQGTTHFTLLVLFSAALSNLAQFWVTGPLFGGLSGVVFAVLGYTWLWDLLSIRPLFRLPKALFGFMIFWLALGYTGALEFIGLGAIANTAHLAGLLSGLAFALISRVWLPKSS